jgi:predicted AlkP superfamily phosphohydrolase/phosphomutase
MQEETKRKTVVIGLDGATWTLLKPWTEQGLLPNIKRLMTKGSWGYLESTIPPVTGPAWISFATGKNPGKHGCYDFVLPRNSLGQFIPITTDDIKGKTFYEIMEQNNHKCILVNMPGSYPPRIKGITITSLLTQGDEYIFPAEIIGKIPELKQYKIIPEPLLKLHGQKNTYFEEIVKVEETRFECARQLFTTQEWDFFFLLFSGTDLLQHEVFNKLVSKNFKESSPLFDTYRNIDNYLGWFIDNIPAHTNILCLSDHGFDLFHKELAINNWLIQEGYLATESRSRPVAAATRGVLEREQVASSWRTIKLPAFLLKYKKFLRPLASIYRKLTKVVPINLDYKTLQLNISQSQAYCISSATGYSCIYINDQERFKDGIVCVEDYKNIRQQIIEQLREMKENSKGSPVISDVWKKEEIYHGPSLHMAPDILFKTNHHFVSPSLEGKVFTDWERNGHHRNGIFMAYGPDITGGQEIKEAKIYDLAPTILHMMNIPVPADVDGKVLTEILKPDSEPANRKVQYSTTDTEQDRIRDKVKKLKTSGRL